MSYSYPKQLKKFKRIKSVIKWWKTSDFILSLCYSPINLHPMFTLRYRKSRDNLSSSDIKLSSRIGSQGWRVGACNTPIQNIPEQILFHGHYIPSMIQSYFLKTISICAWTWENAFISRLSRPLNEYLKNLNEILSDEPSLFRLKNLGNPYSHFIPHSLYSSRLLHSSFSYLNLISFLIFLIRCNFQTYMQWSRFYHHKFRWAWATWYFISWLTVMHLLSSLTLSCSSIAWCL